MPVLSVQLSGLSPPWNGGGGGGGVEQRGTKGSLMSLSFPLEHKFSYSRVLFPHSQASQEIYEFLFSKRNKIKIKETHRKLCKQEDMLHFHDFLQAN